VPPFVVEFSADYIRRFPELLGNRFHVARLQDEVAFNDGDISWFDSLCGDVVVLRPRIVAERIETIDILGTVQLLECLKQYGLPGLIRPDKDRLVPLNLKQP
jgi:hypothetical protein